MKKTFFILFLTLGLGFYQDLKAQYRIAADFNDTQLKTIAQHILLNGKGREKIENHIIPLHQGLDGRDATYAGQTQSYFRLNQHTSEIYRNIIMGAIRNGTVVTGQEGHDVKFSILVTIPMNELGRFGPKSDDSIGAWMNHNSHQYVRKVKVVFSVVNMKNKTYPVNISLEALRERMTHQNGNGSDKRAGDLITAFPIPNNWNH